MTWIAIVTLAAGLFTCSDGAERDTPRDPNRIYTPEELQQALLTFDDLGSGDWDQVQSDAENHTDTDIICDVNIAEAFAGMPTATRHFVRSISQGPWITQQVYSTSPNDAQDIMNEVERAFSCGSWISEDPLTWRIQPLSLRPLGDRSVAYRLEIEDQVVPPYKMELVLIRSGGVIVMLRNLVGPLTDLDHTEEYARRAINRIDDLP